MTWKTIPKFEQYEVSDVGEVRNAETKELKSQRINKHGYLVVNLYSKGKAHKMPVHRLVAFAFLEAEAGKDCVNHKDEDKTNNHASNLEWCTIAYNNAYGTAPQTRAFNRSRSVIMSQHGVKVATFTSIVGMAKAFGVDPSVIGEALRSKGCWRGYDLAYATPGTNKRG